MYTSWAWAFDPLTTLASFGAFPRWRRAAVPLLAAKHILEVGHGSGDLLVELARAGEAPVGLEISASMHRLARRRLAREGITVPRVLGDARALPFRARAFDVVVATFPTDFARCSETLAGFARVSRGGPSSVVFVGPCLDVIWPPLKAFFRVVTGAAPEDLLRQHVEAAEAAGFRVELRSLPGRLLRVPILIASAPSISVSLTDRAASLPSENAHVMSDPPATVPEDEVRQA